MPQDPTPPLTEDRLSKLGCLPIEHISSPGYIVDLDLLEENCALLSSIAKQSGAKILLALKGFACHSTFPIIAKYLSGTTSSGLYEALLAKEFFGKEIHVYSPAFKNEDLSVLSTFAHSIVFNSPRQLAFGAKILKEKGHPQIGLRINPEHSEVETELYDPCAPDSRLGTTRDALNAALETQPGLLEKLDGLHFHALCEQDADTLERTVDAFEARFADLICHVKWVNFGGGHHITRPGYDVERLIALVQRFKQKHSVDVYLEPGEAVALHTGILVATVIDIISTPSLQHAILDTSATCHMPDVLEMPYRPNVFGAGAPNEFAHNYRLGGLSCLAGDVVGDYSFTEPLKIGQQLRFLDMSHYTMVKTTTFNGVALPSINTYSAESGLKEICRFSYLDYKNRLS